MPRSAHRTNRRGTGSSSWLRRRSRLAERMPRGPGCARAARSRALPGDRDRDRRAQTRPANDRDELQRAATELLVRLSREQPLLVIADDGAHSADTETLRLIRRVARRAPEERILILAGVQRDGRARSIKASPRRLPDSSPNRERTAGLTLGRFGAGEVGALVRSSASARTNPPRSCLPSASSPAEHRCSSASSGRSYARVEPSRLGRSRGSDPARRPAARPTATR